MVLPTIDFVSWGLCIKGNIQPKECRQIYAYTPSKLRLSNNIAKWKKGKVTSVTPRNNIPCILCSFICMLSFDKSKRSLREKCNNEKKLNYTNYKIDRLFCKCSTWSDIRLFLDVVPLEANHVIEIFWWYKPYLFHIDLYL